MERERTESHGAPCHLCGAALQKGSWFCTNCGAPAIAASSAERPPTPLPPRPAFPGYTVLDELGAGGMAVVYRARQDALDREVAVKVLRPEVADAGAWSRFEREARIIASLSGHAHVVNTFDVGRTPAGQPFLVTELLDGGSVADAIGRDGPLSNLAAIDVGIAIASALGAAHERGILHRDVKPANVLLGSRGEVKLADFGVARLMANHAHTTTGTIACTPEHAAPEVLRGEQEGAATDVYGLASTVATALLGRSLFVRHPDERIEALMFRKLSEKPAALPTTVPSDLALILDRCLAIDPADRPTLDDVAAEFAWLRRRIAAGSESSADSTDPPNDDVDATAVLPMTTPANDIQTRPTTVTPVTAAREADWDDDEDSDDDHFSGFGWIAAAVVLLASIVGVVALTRGRSDDVESLPPAATDGTIATSVAPVATAVPPAAVDTTVPVTTIAPTTAPAPTIATTVPDTTEPPATQPSATPTPTQTDAPTTTATVSTTAGPVVFSPTPPAAVGDRITEDEAIMVVVWYYQQVAEGNFDETWPKLTQEFRDARDLSFEDYVGYWSTNSIDIDNVRFAGGSDDDARVRFDARYDTGERIVEQVDELILRRGPDGSLLIAAQNRVD